jgi:hypothetical protein
MSGAPESVGGIVKIEKQDEVRSTSVPDVRLHAGFKNFVWMQVWSINDVSGLTARCQALNSYIRNLPFNRL